MEAEELLKLARKEKLGQLESAWVTALGEGVSDLELLLEVPRLLVDRGHAELAESLVWYLIDMLREGGDSVRVLQAARQGGRMLPHSEVMRELLAELYVECHGGRPNIEVLAQATLGDTSVPLDQAIVCLDKILSFHAGAYVLDSQGGGVGRVEGLELENGGLVVDFGGERKTYGVLLAARLELVDEDDFRAACTFERDRLATLAAENPEELLTMVLSTLDRRMELRRLRLYLEPIVGAWPKWWSGVRQMLKRSSVIGVTEGRSPSVFLRARPMSHGERLLQKLRSATGPVARLAVALAIVREGNEHGSLEADVLGDVLTEVVRVGRQAGGEGPEVSSVAGEPAVALAAAAVADAFGRQFPDLRISEGSESGQVLSLSALGSKPKDREPSSELPSAPIAEVLSTPESLPPAVDSDDVLTCTLDFIRVQAPTVWQDFFAAVMPLCGREVCQAAARRLAQAGAQDALADACGEIIARSDRNAGALAWLWREYADSPEEHDLAAVVLVILSAAAALVRQQGLGEEERKRQINELRGTLFIRDGAPLREALQGARPEQVAAIKALGENNPALTEHLQTELMDMLRPVRPSLFEKVVPPWEADVIYATEQGIEKRRAELEYIANVRLPEVIREIGEAAGFGDLSDNAEYRSAVAERGRLAQRTTQMQEEVGGARPITPEMASVDHVTVGSRVSARNLSTDQLETLTFLGPWDAQPEQGIYAYNAPLGLAFMGKRVGDTVTFAMGPEERRWEIVELGPYGLSDVASTGAAPGCALPAGPGQ